MRCGCCANISTYVYTDPRFINLKFCSRCVVRYGTCIQPRLFTNDEINKNSYYRLIRSTRRFGVELEFTGLYGIETLLEKGTRFGFKTEATPTVFREAISPPMNGDLGMLEINKLCKGAFKWGINNRCGFHLHIDLPEKDDLHKIILVYKYTQSLWYLWVAKNRHKNHYCKSNRNQFLVKNLKAKQFDLGIDRFYWMNYTAINKHGTVENRLHEGTNNWQDIKNWVKVNVYLIDWAVKSSIKEITNELSGNDLSKKFKGLSYIWNDRNLSNHYLEKARKLYQIDLMVPKQVIKNEADILCPV